VAVYLKGSNWIPADVLPESASLEYVQELLTACKEANMNALRVWGGGLYESDEFYQVWCPRNEWTLPEMLMDGFRFRWPTDWAS
jgi:beta-mannosidase